MFRRYSVIDVRGVKKVSIFCKKCGFVHDASVDCKLESVKVVEDVKIRRNGIAAGGEGEGEVDV
jgi:hypothetical protein